MEDPAKVLIDELCSLVDETTILSIVNDYDLQKPEEFAAAREVLLTISKNVEAEEASGFNPSGFNGDGLAGFAFSNGGADGAATEGDLKSNDGLTTTTESSNWNSNSHSRAALSSSSSGRSVQEPPGILHLSVLDSLTTEEKERRLADMFTSLRPIDVKLTLQKAKGDADLAMDELLNLQLLEQTGQRPKGVDGFYISDQDSPKAKKKGKGKRKIAKASRAGDSKHTHMATSSEDSSRDEVVDNNNIEFISGRFGLPISEAADLYHHKHCSLGAAILSLLDNYIALGLESKSTPRQLHHIDEQKKRVSWIPGDYFGPVFSMTTTSQAAIDVIDELARHFKKPAHIKYGVSYSVVASDDLEVASQIPLPTSPTTPRRTRTITIPSTLEEAGAAKALIAATTRHSYATASSAYRKGKSDPLMRQVAGFYAERGRSEATSHRRAISAEADLLVDRQSTADTIDLHGVSVQDGVDIALNRVRRWWDAQRGSGNGRGRIGGTTSGGLKVVTGLGRHNPDGKSRLRINVCKALVDDGWNIEILTGACLVTGRS